MVCVAGTIGQSLSGLLKPKMDLLTYLRTLLRQLSAVAVADCDGPAAWQLLSPGLAGEGTLSLVAPRHDAAPRAALSVARHALSNP